MFHSTGGDDDKPYGISTVAGTGIGDCALVMAVKHHHPIIQFQQKVHSSNQRKSPCQGRMFESNIRSIKISISFENIIGTMGWTLNIGLR